MLRILKNKKAQAVASEYVIVFFIVATAVGSMTVYLRRSFQGKIYDAREAMLNMVAVRARDTGYFSGNLYRGYEPYHINIDKNVFRTTYDKESLLGAVPGKTGIFRREIDYRTKINSKSITLPPKDAN